MIVRSHEKKDYKMILNGFFNTFNIEQCEMEDDEAKQIHEVLNDNKIIEDEEEEKLRKKEMALIKGPFSRENLMINNSINSNGYVSYYIINMF